MNRFVTHTDPVIAAQHQCDKHIRKMIVEEAQMLSTALRENQSPFVTPDLYKSAHKQHPCTLWAQASYANWMWAYEHFIGLCDEYDYRFNSPHRTKDVMRKVFTSIVDNDGFMQSWRKIKLTAHPQCFGDWPHKTSESWPVMAYRSYIRDYKANVMKSMKWTRRNPPIWFTS